MARPSHEPTKALRKQVESMSGCGFTDTDIALAVGMSPTTLRKHYRTELDIGHIKACAAVAQSLYQKAVGSGPQSVTAAIFWLKVRLHWKDTSVLEHAGTLKITHEDWLVRLGNEGAGSPDGEPESLQPALPEDPDQGGDDRAA